MLGLGLSIPCAAVRGNVSLEAQVASILRKYGTDAHGYLPGIGVINGLTAGNYIDSAGTTAATVDNPVGLVLDAAGSVGAELTTNGDFSNGLTGWTLNANATGIATVVGGVLTYAAPHGDYAEVKQLSVCTIGKAYKVEFDVVTAGTNVNTITVQCGRATIMAGVGGLFTVGRKSAIVYATNPDGFSISCRADATIAIDNVSVKEVTGINAIQSTTANKPVLRQTSGRYWWDMVDGTDLLTATYPAGWESVTTIDAAPTGQATLTAQNIVGTYAITTDTYGRFVFKTITASELATIQTFANRLAGL